MSCNFRALFTARSSGVIELQLTVRLQVVGLVYTGHGETVINLRRSVLSLWKIHTCAGTAPSSHKIIRGRLYPCRYPSIYGHSPSFILINKFPEKGFTTTSYQNALLMVFQSSAVGPVHMNSVHQTLTTRCNQEEEGLPEPRVPTTGDASSSSPKLLPAHGYSSTPILSVWVQWWFSSVIWSGDAIPVSRVSVTLLSPNSSTIALWIRCVAAWKLVMGSGTEWVVVPLGCFCLSFRSKWMRHIIMRARLDRLSGDTLLCRGTLTSSA